MKHFEVAIVGAGIAGLAAARVLNTRTMIFEKVVGLVVGWRRRRIDDLRVDIGAQFLRPVNHAFRQ